MRKLGLILLAIMIVVPTVLAGIPINDQVSIDGNMRWRSEIDGKDFNSDTGMNEFQTLRTQIGIKVMASDDVLFRVKFKESRYVGTQGSNKAAATEFQAQEAYMCMKNFISPNMGLRVGRYEMWYGRKRILGTGGWNINGPRTYDAVTIKYGNDAMKWDFSYARTSDTNTPAELGAQDDHLFIVAGKMMKGNLQPMVVVDWNQNKGTQLDPDLTYTPAVYFKHKMGGIQLDVDGAVQMGKRADKDVFGWLFAADVSYTIDNAMKPKFGIGVDMTSGNGYDQDADKDARILLPYMSRHLYRGFMDFHKDVNQGMIDGIFRFAIKPSKNYSLSLDVHNFMYMTDEYLDPNDESTSYKQMGQEIDLRYKRNLAKGLGLDCAYCIYMPSEDYKPDADMAHFAYIALTAKF
jgi:hypothetical protein